MEKIRTVSILGPTASGKTGLAIELAKRLGGEIVSCDSMQLYRGMDIGTATPTGAEREGIPHHLMDVLDPSEEFSSADYVRLASAAIDDIASRGKVPILCGGTGLYHDALMQIGEFSEGDKDEKLRDELFAFAEENGAQALHDRLRTIDPEAADAIHPNNIKRVVRAIEVYETTGKTKTETDREQLSPEKRYDDISFVIEYADRATLYSRIEKRVDIMMNDGLEREARELLLGDFSLSKTAAQAIGYKEFLPYFRGECSLDDVAAEIKLATRHYAKRQMIWFRRSDEHIRLIPDASGEVMSSSALADIAEKHINTRMDKSSAKIVEVVAALITKDGRFMICQRPAHKARGMLWEFVGGKVEPGESREDALIRECREELGVIVSVGRVFAEVVHKYPDITVHLTVFYAEIADGEPKLLEHNDLRWITPDEIENFDFCPADETILEKIKTNGI